MKIENNLIVCENGKPAITVCNTETAILRDNFEVEETKVRI